MHSFDLSDGAGFCVWLVVFFLIIFLSLWSFTGLCNGSGLIADWPAAKHQTAAFCLLYAPRDGERKGRGKVRKLAYQGQDSLVSEENMKKTKQMMQKQSLTTFQKYIDTLLVFDQWPSSPQKNHSYQFFLRSIIYDMDYPSESTGVFCPCSVPSQLLANPVLLNPRQKGEKRVFMLCKCGL